MNAMAFVNAQPKDREYPSERRFFTTHRWVIARVMYFSGRCLQCCKVYAYCFKCLRRSMGKEVHAIPGPSHAVPHMH